MDALRCPACGAEVDPGETGLDGWDDELAAGVVLVDFTCRGCGVEFTNVYELARQEVTHRPDEDGE